MSGSSSPKSHGKKNGTDRETLIPVAYQCHGTNVGEMGTLRKGNGNTAGGVPFFATSTGHTAHCLNAGAMGRQDYETETMVAHCAGVRRLTPVECERLQGFPDNWTLVPHRGKPASDGPRYKAIGNSMAVPVMRWIGRRIQNCVR